jgi:DNA-binding transcriptional ArsR family regulator
MDNPMRMEIFDALAASDESMSAPEVAASLGKPLTLVTYHLSVLRREDRIEVDDMRATGRNIEPRYYVSSKH